MNVLSTTWRQLVRRRLWPLAVLLIAALAAVPVLLARDATPVETPAIPETSAPAETANNDDALAEPVVAKASAADRSRRRRVLGSRKNPFEPAPVKKPKAKKTTKDTSDHAKTDTGGGQPPATTPSTPTAPATPVAPAKPKKPAPPKGSLTVRFGDPSADSLEKKLLRKLEGLPDGTTDTGPLVIYTGLTDHGNKAVFLVDASLDLTGDGTCQPHPSSCETVELAAGETEFFDVIDPETGEVTAQYELDLVKIN